MRDLCPEIAAKPTGNVSARSPVIPARDQEDSMRLKNFAAGALVVASFALVGCGTDPGDRAASGGLLGAGAGAVIGAATGNPAAGAVIGGAAGAVVGAATDPCSLDLGNPVWKDHGGRAAYERRCGHPPP
jgi:osmotically inducible lipoprotein OsmB